MGGRMLPLMLADEDNQAAKSAVVVCLHRLSTRLRQGKPLPAHWQGRMPFPGYRVQ